MITINLSELDLSNKINAREKIAREKFIAGTITEKEFRREVNLIRKIRIYKKLGIIKFI